MTSITAPQGRAVLPPIGFVARDSGHGVNIIFFLLAIGLIAVALAVEIWGLVALAMSALALVPVVLTLLILITRG